MKEHPIHDDEWQIRIHLTDGRTLEKTAPDLLTAMGLLASLEDRLGKGARQLDKIASGITISHGDRLVCDDCGKKYIPEVDA